MATDAADARRSLSVRQCCASERAAARRAERALSGSGSGAFNRSVALRLARIPVHGELDETRRAVEAQLLLDPLAMRFHGLDAEAQIARDLASRLAAADQVQHLHLAVAEPFDRIDGLLAPSRGEALDHARADPLADVD